MPPRFDAIVREAPEALAVASKFLESLHPDRIKASEELAAKLPINGALTPRKVSEYMQNLRIPIDELDTPGKLILDIGSGVQQDLARSARELGLRSTIVSVDPRLASNWWQDINGSLSGGTKWQRLSSRFSPEPLTFAAPGHALPFPDQSFDHIYALQSVPRYIQEAGQRTQTMSEIARLLKPDGTARLSPFGRDTSLVRELPLEHSFINDDLVVLGNNVKAIESPNYDGVLRGDQREQRYALKEMLRTRYHASVHHAL